MTVSSINSKIDMHFTKAHIVLKLIHKVIISVTR